MFQSKRTLAFLVITLVLIQTMGFGLLEVTFAKKLDPSTPVAKIEPPRLVETDWSATNWDSEIVLPQDVMDYQNRLVELTTKKQFDEVKKLKQKTQKMRDKKTMEHFNVPPQIQELVLQYTKNGKKDVSSKEELKSKIQALGLTGSKAAEEPKTEVENVIKIDKPLKVGKNAVPYTPAKDNLKLQKISNKYLSPKRTDSKYEYKVFEKSVIPASKQKEGFWDKVKIFFVPPARAQEAVPLISYYEGIEQNLLDFALYYIASQQNGDGSFGSTNKFITTAEVVDALAKWGRNDNDAFNSAVNYLTNYAPETTEEKAIKVRFLASISQNYDALLNEVLQAKNDDGGYGYGPEYTSDTLTTIEVSETLTVIQYEADNSAIQAVYYLLTQIHADGSMYFTAEGDPSYYLINRTLAALYPYREFAIGDEGSQIPVQPKIDLLLNFLVNSSGLDAIDDAMRLQMFDLYGVVFERSIITDLLKELQGANGSFVDLRTTVEAMFALAEPNIQITEVLSQGDLVNRSPANFTLRLKNAGYKKTLGTDLYMFVDNFKLSENLNLENQGFVLGPSENMDLIFNIADTINFIGQTNIKFYIEPNSDIDYLDNWSSNNFVFNPPANNSPALQVYYIAQQDDQDGQPALNIRWHLKPDANRAWHAIVWRKQGEQQLFYSPLSNNANGNFVSSGFEEGAIYYVTAGVVGNDNSLWYFNDFAEVRVSGNLANYRSTVRGFAKYNNEALPDAGLGGPGLSGNTDSEGNFEIQNIPNGSATVNVITPQYESLYTKFNAPASGVVENVKAITTLKQDNEAPQITDLYTEEGHWNLRVNNQAEVRVIATAHDNAAVAEVDYYLWDPTSAQWTYMGAYYPQGTEDCYIWWYVPAELLGEGFKLKAVAMDYRGNESAPREFGPFRIVNGAPPKFTIMSPNGGETLALGTTHQITWTTETANQVSRVNLVLKTSYGSSNYFNRINNTGSFVWDIPLDKRFEGTNFKIQIRGYDDVNFQQATDDSDSEFSIADNSLSPQNPWVRPEVLLSTNNLNPVRGTLQQKPIVRYQNGVMHVVFWYTHDKSGEPRIMTDQFIYLKKQDGVWSAPQVIYQKVSQTDGNLVGYILPSDLKMDISSEGNPFLVWIERMSGGCDTLNASEIFTMNYDGANWTQPQNISNNGTRSQEPSIAVDGNGNAYALWNDGLTWNAECRTSGAAQLYFKKKNAGGEWGAVETPNPTNAPSVPQIEATADGKVHVVYFDGNVPGMRHTYSNGNGWSAPVTVSDGETNFPDLAKGSNSTLHFVYQKWSFDPALNEGRNRVYYNYFDGSSWASAGPILPMIKGQDFESATVFADGNNNPHVAFEVYRSNPYFRNLGWTTKKDGNWIPLRNVNLPSQVVIDNGGNADAILPDSAAVVWKGNYNLSDALFINYADFTKDFIEPAVPANVSVEVRPGAAAVLWNKFQNADNDFNHFSVYRTTNVNAKVGDEAPIAQIDDVNKIEFLDSTVQAGTQYYYALTSVDASENENKNVSFTGPVTPLAPPVATLVQDGDMEMAGVVNWRNYGAPVNKEKTSFRAYSTQNSIRLNTAGTNAGIQQLAIPVQAGKSYRFSFYYNNLTGTLKSWLGIRSSNGDFEGKIVSLPATAGVWKLYSREFTVPPDFLSDFRVVILLTDGDAYIDNVAIEEIAPLSFVRDGDMELNGLENWRNWSVPSSPTEKTNVSSHSPTKSIHLTTLGTHAGIQQTNILLRAGKNYRYSFYYNLLSGTLETNLGIRSSNSDFEGKSVSLSPTNGQWKEYVREFTVPATFVNDFRVIIRIRNGEGYTDDVKIEEIQSVPLVKDGNMEFPDVSEWRGYGTPTLKEKTRDYAVSPVQSLHVNAENINAGVQQLNIPVQAGQNYRYSFRYKLVIGRIVTRLGIRSSNADFESKPATLNRVNDDWQIYTRDFTVPADFISDFRLVINLNNGEGYIDDVMIEKR